ncbi:MAG: PEP-CTERM sorting domain-containing protein [Acidobacteriota bacterium]|nr:PEP-CTERM sorting domain-containing protein [Acidobacteriota bacterium]
MTPTFPSATLTDPNDGVTFSIMNDGGNNYWAINSSAGASATMTIPVGVFGVTNVWTLLNDYWGVKGAQNTSVTLNFGNSATVAGAGMSQTFNFTNGTEIRDATDCTGKSTSPAPGVNPSGFPTACTTFATTTTGSTSQAFSTAYNGSSNAKSQYYNTSGNLVLDDQALLVDPKYFGDYLVNVQVTDAGGGPAISRDALSALTVATPEPASVAMFLGGMTGMFLLYGRRRKAAGSSKV